MSPFWTAFWIAFIYIPLLTMWVFGLVDVFQRRDLSGLARVLWALLIIWVPLIGLVAYYIARPKDELALGYPEPEGPTVGEELDLLADLHDRGKLTDGEFAEEKRRILTAA